MIAASCLETEFRNCATVDNRTAAGGGTDAYPSGGNPTTAPEEATNGAASSTVNTTLPNGNVYEGEFTIKGGQANGHGKATYLDGRCYEGKLKDGKANGQPFRIAGFACVVASMAPNNTTSRTIVQHAKK